MIETDSFACGFFGSQLVIEWFRRGFSFLVFILISHLTIISMSRSQFEIFGVLYFEKEKFQRQISVCEKKKKNKKSWEEAKKFVLQLSETGNFSSGSVLLRKKDVSYWGGQNSLGLIEIQKTQIECEQRAAERRRTRPKIDALTLEESSKMKLVDEWRMVEDEDFGAWKEEVVSFEAVKKEKWRNGANNEEIMGQIMLRSWSLRRLIFEVWRRWRSWQRWRQRWRRREKWQLRWEVDSEVMMGWSHCRSEAWRGEGVRRRFLVARGTKKRNEEEEKFEFDAWRSIADWEDLVAELDLFCEKIEIDCRLLNEDDCCCEVNVETNCCLRNLQSFSFLPRKKMNQTSRWLTTTRWRRTGEVKRKRGEYRGSWLIANLKIALEIWNCRLSMEIINGDFWSCRLSMEIVDADCEVGFWSCRLSM